MKQLCTSSRTAVQLLLLLCSYLLNNGEELLHLCLCMVDVEALSCVFTTQLPSA